MEDGRSFDSGGFLRGSVSTAGGLRGDRVSSAAGLNTRPSTVSSGSTWGLPFGQVEAGASENASVKVVTAGAMAAAFTEQQESSQRVSVKSLPRRRKEEDDPQMPKLLKRHRSSLGRSTLLGAGAASMHKPVTDPHDHIEQKACDVCGLTWQIPKYVDFLADIPESAEGSSECSAKDFPPACQDAVVITQSWDRTSGKPLFPEEVFQNLSLTYTGFEGCPIKMHHRTVNDFEYDCEEGHCVYGQNFSADEASDNNFKYARLVTLNNWYSLLFGHTILIIVDTFALATNIMLTAMLWRVFAADALSAETRAEDHLGTMSELQRRTIYVYLGIMTFLYLLTFYYARDAALWQWELLSAPNVGDIVSNCSVVDQYHTYIAMVFFNIFQVEKLLRDMPIYLHPWKSVQPYAAAKIENTRVHVMGFETKSIFNVVRSSGNQNVQYTMTACGTVLLAYNLHMFYWFKDTGETTKSIFVFSITFASLACLVRWASTYPLVRSRNHMYSELVETLSSNTSGSKRDTAKKLLAMHFRESSEDGKKFINVTLRKHIKKSHEIFAKKHKCYSCARSTPSPPTIEALQSSGSRDV